MKNVLILEDEAVVRKLLCQMLQLNGECNVFEASSVDNALEICGKNRIDVIFCDYNLENGIGWGIAGTIRDNPAKYGRPRLIAMSGTVSVSDPEILRKWRMDLFISKPFAIKELSKLIGSAKKGGGGEG